MTVLALVLLLGLAVARLAPRTPAGAWLERTLVVAPAAWLSRLTWRQALLWGVLAAAFLALAPTLPLELAFAAAGDMAGYLELLALVGAGAAALRSRGALRALGPAVRGFVRSLGAVARRVARSARSPARAPRRRVRTPDTAAEDADGWVAGALAA